MPRRTAQPAGLDCRQTSRTCAQEFSIFSPSDRGQAPLKPIEDKALLW